MRSKFVVKSNKITEISIRDKAYPLTYQKLSVGDSLSRVKNIFPKSYLKRSASKDSLEKVLTIYIGDLEKNIVYDKEIYLLFVEDRLDQIAIWSPL
jgi:hypothetical protein